MHQGAYKYGLRTIGVVDVAPVGCVCLIVVDCDERAVIVADLEVVEAALRIVTVVNVAPRLRVGLIVIDGNQQAVIVADLEVVEPALCVIAIYRVGPRLHESRVENGGTSTSCAIPQYYVRIVE